MASFTRDLSRAEAIYRDQQAMLRRHGVEEELCTVMHSAIVSKSYQAGHPSAFLKRDAAVEGHSSGWYVGILNDPLSMDDESTFELRSLYELSILDERMIPFWLMPVGTAAFLADGTVEWIGTQGSGAIGVMPVVPKKGYTLFLRFQSAFESVSGKPSSTIASRRPNGVVRGSSSQQQSSTD
ncbi:hypothetical protein GCM10011487_47940 [Steroidobacter agaridevorans]|uniref:Imm33-like domain-containing protein n=2 Tax=Steroidobacter agaridevorans TaxID=2695856 RepID=A0A829YHP6_9GAMM|nr:hypothetical protein GCM10011487_47940 [Steroidobacter agaridevorans]